jgi:pimeloyl-ACP methyl ester carboxylesterase
MRRIAFVVPALFAVLGVLYIYPPTRHAVYRGWLILRGELVDVGGYRLRVDCGGLGSPAIVLESGLTYGRKTWNRVWPEVTKLGRAFAYDRAGLGGSDRVPGPRTSLQIIKDLHRALICRHIPPPYVLVGHSFGGLNVRLYASYYPHEVAGLVLINASHEDELARLAAALAPDEREKFLRTKGGKNREGVDLMASNAEVRAAPRIPDVPAVVLSSFLGGQSQSPLMALAEREIQEAVACAIPNCQHIIVENCGHFIQEERPELVVEAIRTVVQAVRNSTAAHSKK